MTLFRQTLGIDLPCLSCILRASLILEIQAWPTVHESNFIINPRCASFPTLARHFAATIRSRMQRYKASHGHRAMLTVMQTANMWRLKLWKSVCARSSHSSSKHEKCNSRWEKDSILHTSASKNVSGVPGAEMRNEPTRSG